MWGASRPNFNIVNIPIDEIQPNIYQPRKDFNDESLKELTNSIKSYGVLQPIVVRRTGRAGYEIIAGERRWRACKKAGLKEIPAIIKDVKDTDSAILALIENIQREDLSFIEEAEGYRQLIQECGVTQEQLAMKLGKSQSTIANKMRILKLSPEIIKIISQEKLTERHARSLLKLPDKDLQMQVLQQVVEKKLSVRQTEELIKKMIDKLNNKNKDEKTLKSFKVAIKDVRIFINSLRKLVKTIKETGVNAEYKEIDKGEYIELTVQLPKR